MPKKSRRTKAKRRAELAKIAKEGQVESPEAMVAKAPEPQLPAKMSLKAQDLGKSYEYVVSEIKRIGILSGAVILILVALSFVLG